MVGTEQLGGSSWLIFTANDLSPRSADLGTSCSGPGPGWGVLECSECANRRCARPPGACKHCIHSLSPRPPV